MRRADRLFEIVQILQNRGRGHITRAEDLARLLEVSERTIYRDIAALTARGMAIEGEAGIGYMLRDGFDLPPLSFTADEIEALLLGNRMVAAWADKGLALAAQSVLQKVEAVLPTGNRNQLYSDHLGAPPSWPRQENQVNAVALRHAIRDNHKIRIRYEDEHSAASDRIVRPLSMVFFPPNWLLAAWCETRKDFRTFRLDRMRHLTVFDDAPFQTQPGQGLDDFIRQQEAYYKEKGLPDRQPPLNSNWHLRNKARNS